MNADGGRSRSLAARLEARIDERGSISGSLREQGREPVAFTGWLGLVGAISELVEGRGGGGAGVTRPLDLFGPGGERADESP